MRMYKHGMSLKALNKSLDEYMWFDLKDETKSVIREWYLAADLYTKSGLGVLTPDEFDLAYAQIADAQYGPNYSAPNAFHADPAQGIVNKFFRIDWNSE